MITTTRNGQMNDFYVYALVRLSDNRPCYIGKGRGDRVHRHNLMGENHPNQHLARIYRKDASPLEHEIVCANLSERQAFDLERDLIFLIGRTSKGLGPLCNMTDGGEGTSGFVPAFTEEHRKKIALSKRGIPRSEECKKKLSESGKGKRPSPEAIQKIVAANTGRKRSVEFGLAISARQKGRALSQETKDKIGSANRGRSPSEETRAKLSAASKGRKYPDEIKETFSAAAKERANRPQERLKSSQRNKGRVHTPESRQRMSEGRLRAAEARRLARNIEESP